MVISCPGRIAEWRTAEIAESSGRAEVAVAVLQGCFCLLDGLLQLLEGRIAGESVGAVGRPVGASRARAYTFLRFYRRARSHSFQVQGTSIRAGAFIHS